MKKSVKRKASRMGSMLDGLSVPDSGVPSAVELAQVKGVASAPVLGCK